MAVCACVPVAEVDLFFSCSCGNTNGELCAFVFFLYFSVDDDDVEDVNARK